MPVEVAPFFGEGWGYSENNFRWAHSNNVSVILNNNYNYPKIYYLSFNLSTLEPRKVTASINNRVIYNF